VKFVLYSAAYLTASAGVFRAPLPPTMTGTGLCTGFGSAGESTSV
jgi:hypothetical protein